ncbi:MAG: glycosyltransferase [Bacillota bacterium]
MAKKEIMVDKFFYRKWPVALNYRGDTVINGMGLVFVLAALLFWGIFGETEPLMFLVVITAVTGLLDDMAGDRSVRGFSGHFRQLIRGRLTTGAFKALIIAPAVLLTLVPGDDQVFLLMIKVWIILLMTNLFNLLDLRPGRLLKVFILSSLFLIGLSPEYLPVLLPLFLVLIFYLPGELQGRYMLGDTGANTLGIIIGYGYGQLESTPLLLILLVFLLGINLLSEAYSFSEIIDKNRFLGWLDGLGR